MKLHFYTLDTSPYVFNYYLDIINDDEFKSLLQHEDVDSILNSDDVEDIIRDEYWEELKDVISSLFDLRTNGVFDWNEKTNEYYEHFDRMLHFLNCSLEYDSGDTVKVYSCELSDSRSFEDDTFSFYIPNFSCGNGEPEGAQLALNIADHFMRANQWHYGFYDANGRLITDIASWAKTNTLDIRTINPVVWFGHDDDIPECWSITPKTTDLFIKEFWGDYYEGALLHICDAAAGLGIYYSVWEYGLDYDSSIFEDIKNRCPINLDLINEDRTNALYNLIVSVYNENRGVQCPVIQKDLYLKDVVDCVIIITSDAFKYSYSKPYRFKPSRLSVLDRDSIEEILLEDTAYRESFTYLKELIEDNCSLSSCENVWKRVREVISQIQARLNKDFICQIQKDGQVLVTIPYSVDLMSKSFLPITEIDTVVFIKSLIEFLKRGSWHVGYKKASELPKIYNAYAQTIPQDGVYPVVWFNDSEAINGKLGIWPAQEQYMLHLCWESASSFCSHVFNNIEVHNTFRNAGSPLYGELDEEFERVKERCPIHIKPGKEPVDFQELEEVVKRHSQN